jgi:hypothetical protein
MFNEKEMMEINIQIAIVCSSQINADITILEDGLDLILVISTVTLAYNQEWLRHTEIGITTMNFLIQCKPTKRQ